MSDEKTVPTDGDQDGVERVVEDAKSKAKEVVDEMTGRDDEPTRSATE